MLPTINFLDPYTLSSIGDIIKIILDYGESFSNSLYNYVSLIFTLVFLLAIGEIIKNAAYMKEVNSFE